jgi:heptosyltransferase-2
LRRILVIRGGAIGDFILTLPAICLLRQAFPAANLEILGYPHIAELALRSGYADAIRSIEMASLASFFVDEGELAPELAAHFGSFQLVVSYLFDPNEIFAKNLRKTGVRNLIAVSPKITPDEHAARQLARPLQQIGLYLHAPVPCLLPEEPREVDRNLIAIHPGSGSEKKNWPLERFVRLADWLLERPKMRLLLVAGEADENRLAALHRHLPNDRIDLARNLSLVALARRLGDCNLFVGHDSGISHLAAAVGTPSILLFGPTDPSVWAPQGPQVRVLRASSLTMDGIDLSEVMTAVNQYELMFSSRDLDSGK